MIGKVYHLWTLLKAFLGRLQRVFQQRLRNVPLSPGADVFPVSQDSVRLPQPVRAFQDRLTYECLDMKKVYQVSRPGIPLPAGNHNSASNLSEGGF